MSMRQALVGGSVAKAMNRPSSAPHLSCASALSTMLSAFDFSIRSPLGWSLISFRMAASVAFGDLPAAPLAPSSAQRRSIRSTMVVTTAFCTSRPVAPWISPMPGSASRAFIGLRRSLTAVRSRSRSPRRSSAPMS